MAFVSGISYKLYDDSGLTTESSTTLQLTHFTDLSDGSQDFTYYFGSTESNRVLKATSNPGVDQITLTATYILPAFVASAVYSLGDIVEPTSANGIIYEVTQAGTASTQPTWPTSIGSTVTTGNVIFTALSEDHPTTEIKLATTEGGLGAGGQTLDIGTEIASGSANAVEIWVRVTNTIDTVMSNYGNPELSIAIEEVQEETA
jgi:hypothetical protein